MPFVVGLLILLFFSFVVWPLILKLVWEWVVPDLFPLAVSAGYLPSDLSLWDAWKLSLLIAILFAVPFFGARSRNQD